MQELNLDVKQKEQLKDLLKNKTTVEAPAQQVPIEAAPAVTEAPEEQTKPVAEEAPKEQPKAEEVEVSLKPWDADDEAPSTATQPTKFDFQKLGSALDLKEVKGEDDVYNAVQALKQKMKELEESPLNAVPEEFREVISLAKKQGDWRSYLAEQVIDYSKVDAVDLFEEEFLKQAPNNKDFYTDGKYDESKALEALDTVSPAIKQMQGVQIRQAYVQQQQFRKQQLAQQANERYEIAQRELSKSVKSLNDVLPVQQYGIQFEEKHSAKLYQGIVDSSLTKKHLGVNFEDLVRSGADMKVINKTIAMAEWGEKMLKYKADAAKVAAKKEILEKTQNPQIRTSTTIVSPENEAEKPKSVTQKVQEYVNRNKSVFG